MIPVTLSIENKKVVIIGGGNIAKRKAKSYLENKAQVIIVSPEISFDYSGMEWIKDIYSKQYIQDAFMVYTATNSVEVNHQVIEDCNQLNILCGSATYEELATMHGMSWLENDFGILAVSSLGRLPYQKPLLDYLNEVFDIHNERLQLLMQLRPYIIKEVTHKQKWFSIGYECPISWLTFLLESYSQQKGTVFVCHQSDKEKQVELPLKHALVVTLEEFEQYGKLFDLSCVKIVPLVLTKGRIYERMQAVIPHKTCEEALLENESLLEIANMLKKEDATNIIVVHPRGTADLIQQIESETQMVVKTFDDVFALDKDTSYYMMIWLMTHGKHYEDFVAQLTKLVNEGYKISWSEPLLYSESMMKLIESKYVRG